jgi:hypothetical protein
LPKDTLAICTRSEVHPDGKATACAAFLRRTAAFFTGIGIDRIERVLTDNAFSYRRGRAWRQDDRRGGNGPGGWFPWPIRCVT